MNVIPMLSTLLNLPAGKDILAKYSSLSAYVAKTRQPDFVQEHGTTVAPLVATATLLLPPRSADFRAGQKATTRIAARSRLYP